jgi:hypothetical protein
MESRNQNPSRVLESFCVKKSTAYSHPALIEIFR